MANIDNVWIEGSVPALASLAAAWDPARMDVLILLAPRAACDGYGRPEGFRMDADGRLTHSNDAADPPPFNNIGFQVLKPGLIAGPEANGGAFSIVPIWKRLSAEGRLYGAVTDAEVIHVSDPGGLAYAEARLSSASDA